MRPGECRDRVPLQFHIANAGGLGIGIVGDLKVIAAQGSYEAQLIIGVAIIDQAAGTAESPDAVVQHVRSGRLQSVVTAIAVEASEVSESLSVASEVH